jgi:hypothetical protein
MFSIALTLLLQISTRQSRGVELSRVVVALHTLQHRLFLELVFCDLNRFSHRIKIGTSY